jgi:hypothetical protein
MAKKAAAAPSRMEKPSRKRPGVHSKKRRSGLKSSVNWKKPYRGQGR